MSDFRHVEANSNMGNVYSNLMSMSVVGCNERSKQLQMFAEMEHTMKRPHLSDLHVRIS